jgi:hypothetical protein
VRILASVSWITVACLCATSAWSATILPDSPTTDWQVVAYPILDPDPIADEQTGISEADIVGDLTTPALYWQFDDNGTPFDHTDGNIGFRVRLAQDKAPGGFDAYFVVGLDADVDGDVDLFIGVNNRGNVDEIGIWDPGTGANTGPSTTSIATPSLVSYPQVAANYDWRAVDGTIDPGAPTDFDGGGDNDYFLTFVVPFADIVAQLGAQTVPILFDDQTVMQFVAATANQPNSLNQDLGGIDGGVNSAATWEALGGFTTPIAANPEPDTGLLVVAGLIGLALYRRRR